MVQHVALPPDPFTRFREIYDALNAQRGWWQDASPLRFAAMTAVLCPGHPADIAAGIRDIAIQVKAESGWFGALNSDLRFVVGAMLYLHEDSATAFLRQVKHVREMFRAVNLSRDAIYESMAVLILRTQHRKAEIPVSVIEQFRDIYEEMKRHHWWLTGPDDFPACALLVGRRESPSQIGDGIERIYQALREAGFSKSNALQSSANILYLSDMEPDLIARRFAGLAEGVKANGVYIFQSDYDELAILTFLDHPTQRVVERVLHYRELTKTLRPKPDATLRFNLAAGIAFLELARVDGDMKAISDAKSLLDMQAIIQAQQAVVAASCAVAAATAAASNG